MQIGRDPTRPSVDFYSCGPYEPAPRLAIGVSGGADSMALTLLAADWARACGGDVLGLIVDHGLRDGSDREAVETCARLAALGIASRVLTLCGLKRGAGLAALARTARLQCLVTAAREAGIVHLLLGHHAGDQAETLVMRRRAGSGPTGLAGMPLLREITDVRLVRPLLDVPAQSLRGWLVQRGVAWVEDPSNADLRAERSRIRADLRAKAGPCATTLAAQATAAGVARRAQDRRVAAVLADRAVISPLGYAVISPGPIDAAALSALWWMLSGAPYPPGAKAICRIAAAPYPTTLGGLRLAPAGRLGPGWLLVREVAPPPVPAADGARWDRFILRAPGLGRGWIGALGERPSRDGRRSGLPACVRRVVPVVFGAAHEVVAVPGLQWGDPAMTFHFAPAVVAAGAPWCGV